MGIQRIEIAPKARELAGEPDIHAVEARITLDDGRLFVEDLYLRVDEDGELRVSNNLDLIE